MTDAPLEISEVDAADQGGFAAYYDAYAVALRHGPTGRYATLWQAAELRARLADPNPRSVRRAWVGLVDGRAVATSWLEASLVDNTDLAEIAVAVVPSDRGRGHGAAVLAHLEAESRALGRTRVTAMVDWTSDDPDGSDSADLRWARTHGFEVGLVDVQRRLALPVDPARLDALEAEAAPHHAAYTLRSFLGPVPDELAEGWVALAATLVTEAPTGDIEREDEEADVADLREREALLVEQGRSKVNTVALAPDGELVAYSDLAVTTHESERAYQWGTLVRRDHRGHRLGMAVKLANLRLLQEAHPQITTVVTYNADVNDHMIGVNARLGFVPVQLGAELQKRL